MNPEHRANLSRVLDSIEIETAKAQAALESPVAEENQKAEQLLARLVQSRNLVEDRLREGDSRDA